MARRHDRLPFTMEVRYRTAGAFLVSYSVNLSKGGIFIESEAPLPVGARVSLHFDVPGAGALEVDGTVAWVRTHVDPSEPPAGMGVEFDELDADWGATIDAMVREFTGLTVLVAAASADRMALLARYVRSIISCDVVEAMSAPLAEVALESRPDLALVDLDRRPAVGMRIIATARARAEAGQPTPVIALAGNPEARAQAVAAGALEALATPPSFRDLQAAVVRTLSRPAAVEDAR
jgi:uncharacterized protein (TIGR02266 family)